MNSAKLKEVTGLRVLPPSMPNNSASEWKEVGFLVGASTSGLVAGIAWVAYLFTRDILLWPVRIVMRFIHKCIVRIHDCIDGALSTDY